MDDSPIQLAVIVGSVRDGRFAPTVADWFSGRVAARDDLKVDVVDLRDHVGTLAGFRGRVGTADAFVVVTPEYNHSFPGELKTAIDTVRDEWRAKPVAFVSYGGLSGGLRATEHLRSVFAELHAVTIRDTVSFHQVWQQFGPDGEPCDPSGPATAATRMLDQLVWWSRTLRSGREQQPYPA